MLLVIKGVKGCLTWFFLMSSSSAAGDWVNCGICGEWAHFGCDRRPGLGAFKVRLWFFDLHNQPLSSLSILRGVIGVNYGTVSCCRTMQRQMDWNTYVRNAVLQILKRRCREVQTDIPEPNPDGFSSTNPNWSYICFSYNINCVFVEKLV